MKKVLLFLLFVFSFSLHSYAQDSIATARTVPDTVKIGAYVMSVHDINFHDKEYTMRFWLWLLHSNPDFDFPNQVDITNAKSIEQPTVMSDTSSGKIWCLMKMKTTMKQSWDVADYPFDKQHLTVKIENSEYDSDHLIFQADTEGSNFDSTLVVDGWDVCEFNVSTGTNEYRTAFGDPSYKTQRSNYSHFHIDMVLQRDAWGLFFKLFIGMYIAFLISSVCFIVDPTEVEPRFGLPVGGLFAAVGNKYIIDSLLPESSTFTLVDSLHALTFLFIFFTIAFSAISLIWIADEKHSKAMKLNKTGGIIIFGSYVVINLILVIAAIL
ncbi:MAG TPA: hypothetical protein VNB90_15380 [Cytophagaceae bacterium]|nr:hypothetical protein [Cytophagaceae bacterium]